MKLEGQACVVTGGGSGIGEAICRRFAEEGAAVAVCDVKGKEAERVASEIRDVGGKAGGWGFDVTELDAVERAADEIEERLGPITTWVNNAGVSRIVPFLECTDEVWDETVAVNLKGAFIGCQAAIRRMLPRRKGVILNMSSQSGKVGSSRYAAYCASKFAVIGLTQSLAKEFARDGIRVNALCPGVVWTPMWDEMAVDYARKHNIGPEDVRPFLEGRIPLGRLCRPEDVAAVAAFLASEDASYITGQAVNITGGSVMH